MSELATNLITGLTEGIFSKHFTIEGISGTFSGSLPVTIVGGSGSSGSTVDRELVVTSYFVKTAFTGASVNDTITCTQILDVTSTPTNVSTIWRNQTTALDLASVPSGTNLTLVGSTALTDAQLRASAITSKISDGTNTATVKAASTAPVATDTAIVVSISPNSPSTASNTEGSVTAGTAATKSNLMGGQFNTTLPTLTTGQQSAIQVDSSGRQIVAPLANTSIVKAQLQDNSGTAIVQKAASTAAVASDTAIVVAVSPNNTIPVNQTQVAGNTVVTGNGVTGTGSQRVTIASDNTAFPIKVSDGTNTGTVKAASTAAVATDTALVVALSPNNTIVTSDLSDGPVTPGTVATKSTLQGGQFNTVLPTLITGQQSALQSDSSGRQIIAPLTNTSIVKAQLQDNAGTAITQKAASTAAAAADPAIVVAISPNSNSVEITDGTNTATVKAGSTTNVIADSSIVIQPSLNSPTMGVIVPATAPIRMDLVGGVYNSTAPTLTTGQSAAIQTDVNGKVQTIANIGSNVYTQSTGNNTSAQLAVASSFVGAIESVLSYPQIILSIRCDQAFTLTIQQFSDLAGTIIYPDIIYKRVANEGFNQPITLSGSYYRIVILNTGSATTTNLFAETWYGTISATPNLTTAGNMPVEQIDITVIGQSAQTAIINNILTPIAGATSTDVLSYRSAAVQVVSTGTGGTFIFEGSNDNTNFQTIGVVNKVILTGTIINGAITATASQFIYILPIDFRYIRLRIVTAITGGNIQAFSRYSQLPFQPLINQIAQNTAASLQTTATQSGTWTTNTGLNAIVADVASAALTVTTTTAAITPTLGTSYEVNIPVTVVTGTSPTLQVTIQESDDTGTNWFNVYDFPTIIAVGIYRSPVLTLTGNRIRYVQTVTGTTPSFTRSIGRLQSNQAAQPTYVGQAVTVSSTITTGGTAQVAIPANAARKNFEIQNLSSGDLFINIGGTASATNGFLLPTKGMYSEPAGYSSNVAISVFGASTGQLYTYIQR